MYFSHCMLFDTLQKDLVAAMKEKDPVRTDTLRFLISALKNEKINLRKDTLEDGEVLKILQKQVKQHQDSIREYLLGNRSDLVTKEERELNILSSYLPTLLSAEEITRIIAEKKTQSGMTAKNDMGKLMGLLMNELRGKADGNLVKTLLEASFDV